MTVLKSNADITHPCLTPVLTSKVWLLLPTWHVKLVEKPFMMRMISCGIPYKRRMRHKLSLCMLSNAFLKSTKLIYSGLCHSVHCSMMLRRVKIWSAHPLPFRNPACSLLSCLSIASEILCMMTFASILLGIDKRVIPRQLSQFFREPFLGIFTITPFDRRSVSSSPPMWM